MYHFVKKFTESQSIIEFTLKASGDVQNILVVLNGNVYEGTVNHESGDRFSITNEFQVDDILECYVILQFIQPDRFTFDTKEVLLSKALARIKRLEYGVYERSSVVDEFSIFKTADNVIKNTLNNKEVFAVRIDNFSPDISEDYESKIKSYITKAILDSSSLSLPAVTNGSFYIISKHTRAIINLIQLSSGVIHNSKVIDTKTITTPDYDVYQINVGTDEIFNDYDFVGHNYIKLTESFESIPFIHIPQNTDRYKTRTYRLTKPTHFYVSPINLSLDSQALTTSPGLKSTFNYTEESSGGSILNDIRDVEILDVPGFLTHVYNPRITYVVKHGFTLTNTEDPTRNIITLEGEPLPDFSIGTRFETTPLYYYTIKLFTDNIPSTVAWPVAVPINLIGTDSVWDRHEEVDGVRYVTKDPIFGAVRTEIPMSWRIYD